MTTIEWTDVTWNPIRGCTCVSEGCRHCYAERLAARFAGPGQPFDGYITGSGSGARWTGRVELVETKLTDPLRWRTPRRVFVNSMSDLFHESLDEVAIAQVLAVIACARRHVFQVLTKRAARMRQLLSSPDFRTMVDAFVTEIAFERSDPLARRSDDLRATALDVTDDRDWPLPNLWLGVSVEDQPAADERMPVLSATPAAIRFVSAEPLLGPVDLRPWLVAYQCLDCFGGRTRVTGVFYDEPCPACGGSGCETPRLDWVIVGGESGPGARPMHPDWARALRDQCMGAGVPFFFKQWGEWLPDFEDPAVPLKDDPEQSRFATVVWNVQTSSWERTNGAWDDGYQWLIATDYWQPEQPMTRVGRQAAGRRFEGLEHNASPDLPPA